MKNNLYVLGAAFLLFSCEKAVDQVAYSVESDRTGFEVRYKLLDNELETVVVDTYSWSTHFFADKKQTLYLYAVSDSIDAMLSVKIFVNSVLVESTSSKGDYEEVALSYDLP